MGDPRGCRIGSIACALALLLFSCSSDDDDGAAAGASAGRAGRAGKDGSGQSGSSASAGASGSAGTRPNGGAGAGGNSAGRGGNAGTGRGGSTAPDAGGPIGFPIAGGGGDPTPADSGLPMSFEGSCESNADCELCTGPISLDEPCCPGCPLVSSREICAQIREVMSMCRPGGLGLCPQVACVAPGSPECSSEGMCVMGNGIEL